MGILFCGECGAPSRANERTAGTRSLFSLSDLDPPKIKYNRAAEISVLAFLRHHRCDEGDDT